MNKEKRKRVLAVCNRCGVEFQAVARDVEKGWGKFCSRDCQRAFQANANSQAKKKDITHSERVRAYKQSINKDVIRSHRIVEQALISGKLHRKPCEKCGKEKVDAHHDDYSKPLDVRWLCRSHHLQHHRSIAATNS